MKIAIVNLSSYENLQASLESLEIVHKEIIDANIDIYTEDNYMESLENNSFLKASYPLHLKALQLIDYRDKYKTLRYYAKQNKYDIAIDTECSFKSALITYIISGRTAGFKLNSFFGTILAKLFYDECIEINNKNEINDKTQLLLAKAFGYEIE